MAERPGRAHCRRGRHRVRFGGMTVSIKGNGPKKKRLGATRWTLLREKFINFRVSGVHKTLEEFGKEESIPLNTLKNRSTKEKWFEEIDRRGNQLVAMHADHMVEVQQGLRERLKFDEIEVRNRLATNGQALEALARLRIGRILAVVQGDASKGIKPDFSILDSITPVDAAVIMRIGQELQRKALGLPEKVIEVDVNHRMTPAE